MRSFTSTIRTIVAEQRSRFPLQHYGWRQVLAKTTPERRACDLAYHSAPVVPFFDCYSSSRQIQEALQERKIRSSLYYLQLPVEGEKRYHHYLVGAERGGEIALIGFTPFETLLGINEVRLISPEELVAFREGTAARSYWSKEERQESCLVLRSPSPERFFPLGFHPEIATGALTELGIKSDGLALNLFFRASILATSPGSFVLRRLGAFSFQLSLSFVLKKKEVLSDLGQEMKRSGDRWGKQVTDPDWERLLSPALVADWPFFAKLVNDFIFHFY